MISSMLVVGSGMLVVGGGGMLGLLAVAKPRKLR